MSYEKLKNKYEKQYKLNCLIGAVMIIVGILSIKVQVLTMILLVVMGFSMIAVAKKNHRNRLEEIGKIKDVKGFDKSMEISLLEMPEFSLFISDQYVVSELNGLNIFVLKNMKKFEVGIAGDKKKSLFLTDKENNRWEIATTVKGDKRQKSFDKVYYRVKDIFDNKKYL